MSHWPRKAQNRCRRQHFWAKLLFISFVVHCTVLFSLFFLYKGDYFSYDVTVSTKLRLFGAPVVFMPFHKVVNKQSVLSTVNKVIDTAQTTKVNTTKPQKKRTIVAAVPQSKKKLVAKKEQVQKKRKKVNVALNKNEAISKKQKLASTKKVSLAHKPSQKNVAKKSVAQKQKRLVARIEQQKPDRAPIYVGQVEMEAIRMQEQLQREMSQHWKPPVGLSKNLECVLKLLIDWNGNLSGAEVCQSSGVLIYDISARTAVAQMQMPQWARGKEFNITFKQ